MSEYNYGPLEHQMAGGTCTEPEWCDDCHGYTHMPWCPNYEPPDGGEARQPCPDGIDQISSGQSRINDDAPAAPERGDFYLTRAHML